LGVILQRVRWISQERVDLPDALNLEAFGNADWAEFIETFFVGDSNAYIVRGFTLPGAPALIGTKTTQVSITVANSMVFHPTSIGAAGAFYSATGTEPAQTASLTANQSNYIELDQATSTGAADQRFIWDEKGGTDGKGAAFSQEIDTVTNLNASVTVNTIGFTANRVPICKIIVASDGTITSITDSRPLFFRLGTGGLSPNDLNTFNWAPNGEIDPRTQRPDTITSSAAADPFGGSDKIIISLKGWMDAVMSSIKEVRGSTYWFSGGSGAGGSITELYEDSLGSFIKPNGSTTTWSYSGGVFTWSDFFDVQATSGPYNFRIPAGNVTLADGQVAYITQIRDQALPGGTALNWVSGATYVNGSVGAFSGLESDSGPGASPLARGNWIKRVSDGQEKYVRILNFYDQPNGASGGGAATTAALAVSVEIVGPTGGYAGTTTTEASVYSKGAYQPVIKSLTDPTLTFDPNKWWLVVRYGAKVLARDGFVIKDGESRLIGYPINDQLIANVNTALAGRWSSVTIADGSTSLLGDFVGSTQAVFNSAIAALPNGGTIYVKRGTYTFASKVTISTNKIRIVGEGNELVIITGAISGDALFELTGTDCLLEQLSITNTSASANAAAVKLNGSAGTNGHNEISHCDIYASGNPAGVTYGIRLGRDNHRYVHDCRISLLCSSGVTTAYGIGLVESDTTGSQFNINGDRFINNTFVNVSSGGLRAEYFHIDVTANHAGALAAYHHAVIRGNKDVGATNTLSWPVRLFSTFTAGVSAAIDDIVIADNMSNYTINPAPIGVDLNPSGGGTIYDIVSVGNIFGNTYLNPSATVGLRNTLVAKNIVKSWGHITFTSTPTIVVDDGFNCTASFPGGNILRVTFPTNGTFPTGYTTYTVIPYGVNQSTKVWWVVNAKANDHFDLTLWQLSSPAGVLTETQINPAGTNGAVMFVVLGAQ
jgi:hypothetical protein